MSRDRTAELESLLRTVDRVLAADNVTAGIRVASARALIMVGLAPCSHKHWTFKAHGRVCTCGAMMMDMGD